jgi:hypothetical protein
MPVLLARQLLPGVWGQDSNPVILKDALTGKSASLVDQVFEANDATRASTLVSNAIASLLEKKQPIRPQKSHGLGMKSRNQRAPSRLAN